MSGALDYTEPTALVLPIGSYTINTGEFRPLLDSLRRSFVAKQAAATAERSAFGCKSIERLCGARSRRREEARLIGCWQSGDWEGGEETVGEG